MTQPSKMLLLDILGPRIRKLDYFEARQKHLFKIDNNIRIALAYALVFPGNSPINPFLSTIAKQRGYSPSVVGNILTLLLLLNIVVKPLTGYVTDRWKCRRTVFLGAILLNGLITPTLYLVPGATSSVGEMSNAETFGSLQFWLFSTIVMLRMVLFMMGEVLQETICMGILGTATINNNTYYV